MPPKSYYSGKKSNWKSGGRAAGANKNQGYNQFSRKSGSTKITPKTVKKNKSSTSFFPVIDAIKNFAENIGPIKILPAKLPDTKPKGTKIITNKMPGTNKYKISTVPYKKDPSKSKILTEKDFGTGPRNPYDAFKKDYPKGTKKVKKPIIDPGVAFGGTTKKPITDPGVTFGTSRKTPRAGIAPPSVLKLMADRLKVPVSKPFRPTASDVKGTDYATRRNKLSTVDLPKPKPKSKNTNPVFRDRLTDFYADRHEGSGGTKGLKTTGGGRGPAAAAQKLGGYQPHTIKTINSYSGPPGTDTVKGPKKPGKGFWSQIKNVGSNIAGTWSDIKDSEEERRKIQRRKTLGTLPKNQGAFKYRGPN